MAPRYAIYFVPAADSPLYRFGASVMGYDCYRGKDVPLIDGADPSAWSAVVREPRVYGFHATLKAPFSLANSVSEGELLEAAHVFSEMQPAVTGGQLALRAIGSFLALVPVVASADIHNLAQACVEEFDRFRAPTTAAERARRLAARLTPRQTEYMDRWGYPYVFDEFRFHMTLTGSLAPAGCDSARRFLNDHFTQLPAAQILRIDRIAVVKQDGNGAPFRVVQPFALRLIVIRLSPILSISSCLAAQ